ncbi:MAG: hypothetical protein ABIC91_08455 [Nanoarchaeota archaeon]|nr:hypothetical protein [Nanoarchaeota archaeon]MBU1030333.1 hypothetical protein [Nanoarchaeota archaeon]MBU1850038.1 hypothetical protein [Nanoarchaeota archaeon]
MDNITKTVWGFLDSDPILRSSLSRNVINKRALAFYIIKTLSLSAPVNAVISAIRRYQTENPLNEVFTKALEVISDSTMSSKNGIVSLTLEKDQETEKLIPKLFTVVEVGKNNVLRIIQADESIKILIDQKNLKKAKEIVPEQKIVKIEEDLAEVTIHLDERAWYTPGVVTVLSSQLSGNHINIIEIMSCIPEIIIFFKEKDLMSAYNVLYNLANKNTTV